ncbi:DUF6082 family protein [Streptomyces sp. SID8499]|uniref:DUF6082 family protein n=1 Tax=Streptomyces sp. SID8499 TaxID=2706106 RepID=UPI0013AD4455|nr:DUF6082 family protein [Streptomyces sp. SID8499]MYS43131.1 hypothetical protein [Streptomyces sp. SID5998]NED34677.1 hypothetical protein [Streptomyces sp. SID8499]
MATQKKGTGRFGSAATGLLLATAALTLAARQRRLEAERLAARRLELEELSSRRTALRHQQRMHWELLARAIDDPSLAAVINTYDAGIPVEKRRQFLYANAWYVNLYHLHRAGLLDERELFGRLREIFQNPVMREYWEASKEQRATLEHASDEARIGRMVDGLIRDLDEADTDEWWVVGTPPPSAS